MTPRNFEPFPEISRASRTSRASALKFLAHSDFRGSGFGILPVDSQTWSPDVLTVFEPIKHDLTIRDVVIPAICSSMDPKTRLRKACDACSIRKVKVWFFCHNMRGNANFHASVIPVGHRVGHALAWIFPAPMKDQADAAGPLTAMQKLSRNKSGNLKIQRRSALQIIRRQRLPWQRHSPILNLHRSPFR